MYVSHNIFNTIKIYYNSNIGKMSQNNLCLYSY
jgi:hypothetical protein